MRGQTTTPRRVSSLVDLGDAAVLGVAEASDQGDDVEAELVVGQGEAALGLGAVGAAVAGAVGVVAAADLERSGRTTPSRVVTVRRLCRRPRAARRRWGSSASVREVRWSDRPEGGHSVWPWQYSLKSSWFKE